VAHLEAAGFAVSLAAAQETPAEEVGCEDEFADVYAQLLLNLVTQRTRRLLWLSRGWPWSAAAVLDCSAADAAWSRFRRDAEVWRALQAKLPTASEDLQYLYKRHVFHTLSCQQ
jgi:hypothetical protein